MSDTAAHLVDSVLPRVPVRQWVLSMPRQVRYRLARDAKLLARAAKVFVSEVFRDLRRRARLKRGVGRSGRVLCGAVTVVQRFGGALNLNVHFHTLVLDGCYVEETGRLRFVRLPPPIPDEMERVVERVRRRVWRLCGLDSLDDASGDEPSLFDRVQAASIREWVGLGEELRPVPKLGRDEERSVGIEPHGLCAAVDGFSMHAGVRTRAGDREGLEQVCRYILRPAFSGERLERLADGRVAYGLRKARADGTTHVVLTPMEFMEKLAALVAPPRSHLVRYHGVLAPASRRRGRVVPRERREREGRRCDGRGPRDAGAGGGAWGGRPGRRKGRTRMDWASLAMRSLGEDVLGCPRCGGRMRVIACITERRVVRTILRAMGLPEEAPVREPARAPPASRPLEVDQS